MRNTGSAPLRERIAARTHALNIVGMLVAVAALVVAATLPPAVCGFHIADFCYRTPVTIAKSTAGDLDEYPLAVTLNVNRLSQAGRIGDHGWDVLPADGTTELASRLVQDVDTNTDTTVWLIGDVPGSGSNLFDLYSGNAAQQWDGGVYFHQPSGADAVSVPDDATLDITDDLDIIVTLSTSTPDAATMIVDKLTANAGYEVRQTTTGAGKLAFSVGNGAATSTLEADWDGTETTARFRFDAGAANDMDISYLVAGAFVSQASQDAGYASLGTNAQAVAIGSTFNGEITEVEIRDDVGLGTYAKVSQWSFNAADVAETQAGTSGNGWTYLGTVADSIGSNNATYSFVRDQSDLTVTLGATIPTFGALGSQASEPAANVVGALTTGDATSNSGTLFAGMGTLGSTINTAIGGTELAPTAFRFFIVAAFAIAMGGLAFLVVHRVMPGADGAAEIVAAIVIIAFFGVGAAVQLISVLYAMIAGFLVLIAWLAVKQLGRASE